MFDRHWIWIHGLQGKVTIDILPTVIRVGKPKSNPRESDSLISPTNRTQSQTPKPPSPPRFPLPPFPPSQYKSTDQIPRQLKFVAT